MGGAVAAVTKPVVKALGGGGGAAAPVVQAIQNQPSKTESKVSRADEELAARRRGARRRGAMLMSDATLNQANETLGGGGGLGQ